MSGFSGKRRFILISAVVALVLIVAVVCIANRRPSRSPSLIVVAGAQDVHYSVTAGTQQVRYEVHDTYPAKATLTEISSRLAKQGWDPLKEDFANPGHPSSHQTGWTTFLAGDGAEEAMIRQWLAQWTDASGNIVVYGLRYRSPLHGSANTRQLQVYGVYMPAKVAQACRSAMPGPE